MVHENPVIKTAVDSINSIKTAQFAFEIIAVVCLIAFAIGCFQTKGSVATKTKYNAIQLTFFSIILTMTAHAGLSCFNFVYDTFISDNKALILQNYFSINSPSFYYTISTIVFLCLAISAMSWMIDSYRKNKSNRTLGKINHLIISLVLMFISVNGLLRKDASTANALGDLLFLITELCFILYYLTISFNILNYKKISEAENTFNILKDNYLELNSLKNDLSTAEKIKKDSQSCFENNSSYRTFQNINKTETETEEERFENIKAFEFMGPMNDIYEKIENKKIEFSKNHKELSSILNFSFDQPGTKFKFGINEMLFLSKEKAVEMLNDANKQKEDIKILKQEMEMVKSEFSRVDNILKKNKSSQTNWREYFPECKTILVNLNETLQRKDVGSTVIDVTEQVPSQET